MRAVAFASRNFLQRAAARVTAGLPNPLPLYTPPPLLRSAGLMDIRARINDVVRT